MIDTILDRIPVQSRVGFVQWALVVLAFAAGVGVGFMPRSKTYTVTRTVKLTVAQQYGKPSGSIAGAKVNAEFKGLTCRIWQARATVICQP